MSVRFRRISVGIVIFLALLILGCASVPQEAVELSYVVGEDLEALHHSYRNLIYSYFDALRAQRIGFLENKWIPLFLKSYIKKAQLVDLIRDSDASEAFNWVSVWVEVAMDTIAARKKWLLDPIDQGEAELTAYVDDAFKRVIWANSTLTAHLESIRNVHEAQEEVSAIFGMKDLRDKINRGLIIASEKADEALRKFEEADELLIKAEESKQKIRDELEGGSDE